MIAQMKLAAPADAHSREDATPAVSLRVPDTWRRIAAGLMGLIGAVFVAQWAAAEPAPAAASGAATTATGEAAETGLAEITVTAEKYKSTIQDTPISLSALSGDALTNAGITSIETLAHDVPGLSMRSAGPGLTEYEARGLASNGGAAPTVGFYLDEIPLSPPALSQSGKVVIDPNLYDVERVEVLRGPQGTLYGSGSMGGTIKVITNKPKLGTFEGSVQGTLSDTQGGSGNCGGKSHAEPADGQHVRPARRRERPVSQRLDQYRDLESLSDQPRDDELRLPDLRAGAKRDSARQ